jgi:hypothetical protein
MLKKWRKPGFLDMAITNLRISMFIYKIENDCVEMDFYFLGAK